MITILEINIQTVKKQYPNAYKVIKAEHGFMVFATAHEYENWLKTA